MAAVSSRYFDNARTRAAATADAAAAAPPCSQLPAPSVGLPLTVPLSLPMSRESTHLAGHRAVLIHHALVRLDRREQGVLVEIARQERLLLGAEGLVHCSGERAALRGGARARGGGGGAVGSRAGAGAAQQVAVVLLERDARAAGLLGLERQRRVAQAERQLSAREHRLVALVQREAGLRVEQFLPRHAATCTQHKTQWWRIVFIGRPMSSNGISQRADASQVQRGSCLPRRRPGFSRDQRTGQAITNAIASWLEVRQVRSVCGNHTTQVALVGVAASVRIRLGQVTMRAASCPLHSRTRSRDTTK